MPDGAERLVRPEHVLHRHRGAVGESGLLANRELDPAPRSVRLDQFGEEAVERERLVPVPAHQALEGEVAELPGDVALEDVRIERIEAADLALDDPPALGRVGVRVGKGHKIGWQGGVAIHSYAMLRLGRRDARPERETQRAQTRPRRVKRCVLICATMLLLPRVLCGQRNAAPEPFQTFSLDIGGGARIKSALLDRFLACMKPASITERRPRAGVFLGSRRTPAWLPMSQP